MNIKKYLILLPTMLSVGLTMTKKTTASTYSTDYSMRNMGGGSTNTGNINERQAVNIYTSNQTMNQLSTKTSPGMIFTEKDLRDYVTKLKQADIDLTQKKIEVENLESSKKKLEQEKNELEQEKEDIEKQLDDLKKNPQVTNPKVTREYQDLEREKEQLEISGALLGDRINELEKIGREKMLEKASLEIKVGNLENNISLLKNRINNLEVENRGLKEKQIEKGLPDYLKKQLGAKDLSKTEIEKAVNDFAKKKTVEEVDTAKEDLLKDLSITNTKVAKANIGKLKKINKGIDLENNGFETNLNQIILNDEIAEKLLAATENNYSEYTLTNIGVLTKEGINLSIDGGAKSLIDRAKQGDKSKALFGEIDGEIETNLNFIKANLLDNSSIDLSQQNSAEKYLREVADQKAELSRLKTIEAAEREAEILLKGIQKKITDSEYSISAIKLEQTDLDKLKKIALTLTNPKHIIAKMAAIIINNDGSENCSSLTDILAEYV